MYEKIKLLEGENGALIYDEERLHYLETSAIEIVNF